MALQAVQVQKTQEERHTARPGAVNEAQPVNLVVVIPARDEEAVIVETLGWLGGLLEPEDRVHVIADRCSDRTAEKAWRQGAIVHVRRERDRGNAGKTCPAYRMLPRPLAVIGAGDSAGECREGGPAREVGCTFGLRAAAGTPGIGGSPFFKGGVDGSAAATKENGKGAALRWWLQQSREPGCGDEVLLIMDADTRAAPDLIPMLKDEIRKGNDVVQARIAPMACSDSPVAMLAALSEVVEHRVKGTLRSRLGWPVRLRGTGMAIRRHLLEDLAPRLKTFVEDSELTLLLAERGIKVHYLDSSYAADPKPEDAVGASAQRARWFQGQMELLRVHRRSVLRLLLRGPWAWSLLASIFLRPVTLVAAGWLVFLGISAATYLYTGSTLAAAAAWAAAIRLGLEAAVHLAGFAYVPDRVSLLKALLRVPVFLIVWLKGVLLSFRTGGTWHCVRAGGE